MLAHPPFGGEIARELGALALGLHLPGDQFRAREAAPATSAMITSSRNTSWMKHSTTELRNQSKDRLAAPASRPTR